MGNTNWLVILLIVGVAAYALNIGGIQQLIGGGTGAATPPPSGGGVTPPASNGACPDTLETEFLGDSVNPLNTSKTDYQTQTFRLVPGGNFAEFVSYATTTTVQGTAHTHLQCGKAYTLYPLATQDVVNSVAPVELGEVSGAHASKVVIAPNLLLLQSKAYDNANHAFIYEAGDAAAGTNDAMASVMYSSTSNYTGTAIGVGGYIDWTFAVSAVDTDGQFGNSDLGLYIAVDADKSEYDTPTLWIGNVALQNVKGTGEVSANDEAVLSSYEYIFKVPAGVNLRTAPTDVRMYLAAKAGQDPSGDPVLRFVGKGYYVGADGISIKKDIFNEATNSEILTGTPQTITVTLT
jgi:hypothetical protein